MELSEHGFLEELLELRREPWETFPSTGMSEFSNGWSFDCFDEKPGVVLPNSSFEGFTMSATEPPILDCSLNEEVYYPFGNGFSVSEIDSSSLPPFPNREDEEPPNLVHNDFQNLEETHRQQSSCKMEPIQTSDPPVYNMGLCLERKNRVKKVEGQPSKNLMAERRRRKRLNDRLSMLRSVVPKISKMDRTSILGDTIDYMKELLERIKTFKEDTELGSNQLNLMGIFKELKPNEILVRNTPKFEVERGNVDTRIEICCAGKPGLLLSTVTTLEALGLEIQQCVTSCFNDFTMQVSCSEEREQRAISSEDIKQALFRNAGYGGRCL